MNEVALCVSVSIWGFTIGFLVALKVCDWSGHNQWRERQNVDWEKRLPVDGGGTCVVQPRRIPRKARGRNG